MNLAHWLEPSAGSTVLAAAAVIGGAPLFAAGVHALRLRRQLGQVRPTAFGEAAGGRFAQLTGVVALESPLFGPLSGLPCAGYALEVQGVGAPVRHEIVERRAFRLDAEDGSAHVSDSGRWSAEVSATREIGADEGITAGLAALLARAPEALWWRRAGGRLRLVERALRAGAIAHVVGRVEITQAARIAEAQWLQTGTGEPVWSAAAPDGAVLAVGGSDPSEWMLVSDRPPDPASLSIPLRHVAGAVIGPLLSLAGMVYLANAADQLQRVGRF